MYIGGNSFVKGEIFHERYYIFVVCLIFDSFNKNNCLFRRYLPRNEECPALQENCTIIPCEIFSFLHPGADCAGSSSNDSLYPWNSLYWQQCCHTLNWYLYRQVFFFPFLIWLTHFEFLLSFYILVYISKLVCKC